MNKALGICIGASTISFVFTEKENDNIRVTFVSSIAHEGNPRSVITEFFSNNLNSLSETSVIITGRKFKNLLKAHNVPEPEAIEKALKYLAIQNMYGAIASLGGENFIVYCLDKNGSIDKVLTGNKCASGTGEFFLQQIGRMNLNIEEAVEMSKRDAYYSVSGRCSVFCKSDCTHALNKGIEKGLVVRGLCKMIADKTIELLAKQNSANILIIGGVSQNSSVVKFITDKYPEAYIPKEAAYFEALGASLLALDKEYILDKKQLFWSNTHSFPLLEPLINNNSKVTFKDIARAEAEDGDECILGLDVGSTTTKAVLIRERDNALLASVYLRTNGNPVQASVECYESIKQQVKAKIKIKGLGTTGSGRHIAALHALTKGVVNEIIAHAIAAAFFDKDVDTIFEIGGQDAKYTHLTNAIASDYAMNEACSAGTGSFLEESAKETLNIYYKDIAEIAFKAKAPLNFNDQCAAFISSDIKSASHEGAEHHDIVAGLVYSICMNYVNRVKGNRPVGKKVFMQGGVCYNKAVPYAMSALINKEIIVPPEPGLMGAFGVALEIKNRIHLGFLDKGDFELEQLISREFHYEKEFICAGGREKCDRKCSISVIKVEGKKYPFGGACSKYYNERSDISCDTKTNDFVKIRQDLVFKKYCQYPNGSGRSIGITRSFQVNTLFPLYYNFFAKLGFHVVLADKPDPAGLDKMASSFCYPVEIAHGLVQDLINKNVDYIFLPHVSQMDHDDDHKYKRLCVFVQGEPYYIRSAFADTHHPPFITPVLDLTLSETEVKKTFVSIARQIGVNEPEALRAFEFADSQFKSMLNEFKNIGRKILEDVEANNRTAMVLFGRAYNAFAGEANLNIPHKFASRNIIIIPHDFLPNDDYGSYSNMYWFSGQQILRSARFVKDHPLLFGVYITNFSCGPDSFILSYFRNLMGNKPSLTLELDSHSADVGVDTRIDAALDIIRNYNELKRQGLVVESKKELSALSIESRENRVAIIDDEGNEFRLTSPEVEVIIPSMGRFSTESFSAVCRSLGFNSKPLPIPTSDTLKFGRGLTTCKECLPFILTTGSLIEYVEKVKNSGKKVLFFMPHGYGPCRQGQYYIMLKDIINNLKYKNIGVLSMDDESSFDDLGNDFYLKGWLALMTADIIHDIESVINTLAVDKESSLQMLESEWEKIISALESGNKDMLFSRLQKSAETLKSIKLKTPLKDAKVVSLIGEIYVRREEFSRQDLIHSLVDRGFVVRTAPITEYLYYSNYLIRKGIVNGDIRDKAKIIIKDFYQRYYEKKIKKILAASGLYHFEMIDIDKTVDYGKKMVSEKLVGETIITAGLAVREILDNSCGVISIGPFNCMPSRLSEALLNREMTIEGKYRNGNKKSFGYSLDITSLPFLYIESDGNPYPQITQSRLEIFMMQAEKVHHSLKNKEIKKT